jgi:hypothetical protein
MILRIILTAFARAVGGQFGRDFARRIERNL